MKTKKELLLIIIGAALSVALIVSMIIIIVSSNNHKGQNHEIAWEVSVTPTYETEGLATGKCTKCKKEFKEKLPVLTSNDYKVTILSENRSCAADKEAKFETEKLDNIVSFNAVLKAENHSLDGMEISGNDSRVFLFDENNVNPKIKFFADEPLSCSTEGVKCYFQCDKCNESVIIHARKEHAPQNKTLEDIDVNFPNCTDSGITEPFTCKYCAQTVQVTVPSRGHDYECDVKPNGTSPETYTVTLKCKRCGADESKQNVVSVTEDKIEPECGKIGKINYTLGLPGGGEFKFTVYLPALEHESIVYGVMDKEKYSILAYPGLLSDDIDESEIKCNSKISYVGAFDCVHCNRNIKVKVYRPHKAPENTKWIDDTSKGIKYRTFKCEECGEQVREEIPAEADHDYVYTVKKLSGGYEVTGACIYCSDVKTIKIDKVEEAVVKQATCKEEGKKVYTFTVDGKTCSAVEAIEKLPHVFQEKALDRNAKNYFACNTKGLYLYAENTTDGYVYCESCNQIVGVYITHTEPDASEIVIIEPTTETEGKRIYKCKACGKQIEETIPKKDKE